MNTMTRRPENRMARNSFACSESGNAGIEFALLAPFIIGLYLGLAELSVGMSVDRQVSHSASVAGDLATQATNLDEAQVADIMSATMRVAGVSDAQNMTIELQSFSMDDTGKITKLGTAIYNPSGEAALQAFDVQDLGSELLSSDSGVVVARVRYPYKPIGLSARKRQDNGQVWLPSELNFAETFLLKPRRSTTVEIGGKDMKTSCSGSYTSVTCTTFAK